MKARLESENTIEGTEDNGFLVGIEEERDDVFLWQWNIGARLHFCLLYKTGSNREH